MWITLHSTAAGWNDKTASHLTASVALNTIGQTSINMLLDNQRSSFWALKNYFDHRLCPKCLFWTHCLKTWLPKYVFTASCKFWELSFDITTDVCLQKLRVISHTTRLNEHQSAICAPWEKRRYIKHQKFNQSFEIKAQNLCNPWVKTTKLFRYKKRSDHKL